MAWCVGCCEFLCRWVHFTWCGVVTDSWLFEESVKFLLLVKICIV